MDIQYIDELLLPGILGQIFIIIAISASFISFLSYLLSVQSINDITRAKWYRVGKISFLIHALSIVMIIGIIYFLIFNHRFEYDYIRRHSAIGMPVKYLISCFWAGQQGSFLLWLFWHAVLGVFILFKVDRQWSTPMLAVFSLIQIIILSMILGISIPRGAGLILVIGSLSIPIWVLFLNSGIKGWKSIIPVLNVISLFSHKSVKQKWFLLILLIPINLIFLVLIPLNLESVWPNLSETISIGASPFVLSREMFMGNPIFMFSDYTSMVEGRGLNPLLENYWMVIHPPTLFLGFASTLVPFAFAISGLWMKKYTEWVNIAIPWTLFSAVILGTGIMMGGIWAYESLSFGGFWAWDPVENASFIPWLIMLGAMHTMVSFKHSGYGIRTTNVLLIISFLLVLYSTFLTRSGILGDSSVHSFTDLGMMGLLIVLIIAMIIPAIMLLVFNWKNIPIPIKEERASSREFWMFIGALVLLISAIQITYTTSIPVVNNINSAIKSFFPFLEGLEIFNIELFKSNMAPPDDPTGYYNKIQIWFGILITLMTASIQYLKYKSSNVTRFLLKIAPVFVISIALTIVISLLLKISNISYLVLLCGGIFAVLGNSNYIIVVLKGKLSFSGASLAHTGFGLIMIGLIISLGNSKVISKNTLGIKYSDETEFGDDFNQRNILLPKDKSMKMGDYLVTYGGRIEDGRNFYYRVNYVKYDESDPVAKESFQLRPHVLDHPDMGIVTNPATKKYLFKDIFTHVTSIPINSEKRPSDEPDISIHRLVKGDSVFTSLGLLKFERFVPIANDSTTVVTAEMHLNNFDTTYILRPAFIITGNQAFQQEDRIEELDFSISLTNIHPDTGEFEFRVSEKRDWIIMKAIIFPFINLLWAGIVLTVIGFIVSIVHRAKSNKRLNRRENS